MPSLYIGEQPVRTVALASNNDDATAVAADVMKDKIAYNQYGKIVGTAEPAEDLDSEMTAQDSLIEQIKSALVGKVGVSLPVLSNPAGAANIEAGYQAIDSEGKLIVGTMKGVTIIEGVSIEYISNMTTQRFTILHDLLGNFRISSELKDGDFLVCEEIAGVYGICVNGYLNVCNCTNRNYSFYTEGAKTYTVYRGFM